MLSFACQQKKPHIIAIIFVGRGGGNRTHAKGFGDLCTTIIRRPYGISNMRNLSNQYTSDKVGRRKKSSPSGGSVIERIDITIIRDENGLCEPAFVCVPNHL